MKLFSNILAILFILKKTISYTLFSESATSLITFYVIVVTRFVTVVSEEFNHKLSLTLVALHDIIFHVQY